MKSSGIIYLVGAGPGDPGLLTLRGADLLARAEVVVHDDEVNRELLQRVPKGAEILSAGPRAARHDGAETRVVETLLARARAGKAVVRLIAGDPYLFGGGSEEAAQLAQAKIPFEVVPGVSPLVAAPNYAGIPPTHRDYASQLTLAAGAAPDWAALAAAAGTKVIHVPHDAFAATVEHLVQAGIGKDVPITVIAGGTTGAQRSVSGALGEIARLVAREKFEGALVAIIGGVVALREKLNWFEQRPLFGKRVVVTRSREQAGQLSRQLRERGAEVLEVPTIKFEPPTQREILVDALLELNSYDWLVFTSPNGVTTFFEYFFRQFHDMRDLGGARIAAVGPATAGKLKELHLQVDLMPDEAISSQIAEAFSKFESVENLKICIIRAEVANPELPRALEALGAIVDDIPCYKTVPETEDLTGSAAALTARGADWVAFTSSSTVEHFNARFDLPALAKKYPSLKLATIGPETSKAVTALGLKPTVEAKQHTIDGLVDAIAGSEAKK